MASRDSKLNNTLWIVIYTILDAQKKPSIAVAPSLAGKYAARTEDGLERVVSLMLEAIA
jgi:hypothetical protein